MRKDWRLLVLFPDRDTHPSVGFAAFEALASHRPEAFQQTHVRTGAAAELELFLEQQTQEGHTHAPHARCHSNLLQDSIFPLIPPG